MKKFYKFTQSKAYGENPHELRYKKKPTYINLETVASVFENQYGSIKETVIGLINGATFTVEESMDEVMKILEN